MVRTNFSESFRRFDRNSISIRVCAGSFVRKTLQLEGITSLKMAVQKAMTVKIILENNSEREKDHKDYNRRSFEGKNINFRRRKYDSGKEEKVVNKNKENGFNKNYKGSFAKKEGEQGKFVKECWQCDSTGHFRADCPFFEGKRKEN